MESTVFKQPSMQEALYRSIHNAHVRYRTFNQGIRRMRNWLSFLKDPPSSVLEVGCGNGILCDALVMMGYDVTGLDIVPGPYKRQYYHFVKHDLRLGFLPFKDKEFDYCTSFDVIEHLEPKWVGMHISEMSRVSDFVIGTAACYKSGPLHRTIKDKDWWKEVISRSADKEMEYLISDAPCGQTVLFHTKVEGGKEL